MMITRARKQSQKTSSWERGLGKFDFRAAEEALSDGELSSQQIRIAFPKAIRRGVELLEELEALRCERDGLSSSLDEALELITAHEATIAGLRHERELAAKRQGTLTHCGCHRDKYAFPSPEKEEVSPEDETSEPPYEEIDAQYAAQVAAQVEAEEAETWSEERVRAEEYRELDRGIWEDFANSL